MRKGKENNTRYNAMQFINTTTYILQSIKDSEVDFSRKQYHIKRMNQFKFSRKFSFN